MTCDEYLARQQRQALRSLGRATRLTGAAVEQAVDLQGHVRRRPALTLGLGALAGFVVAGVVSTRTRRLSRGVLRSTLSPLVRPTLGALGALVARMLLGSDLSSQE